VSARELPPHDLEAEAGVLGAILLDGAVVGQVADWLKPEDFYRENNGQVYRAALNLFRAGKPIDGITLGGELEKLGVLERIGGRAHLALLESNCPTAANVEPYAQIVKDRAERRRGIEAEHEGHKARLAALHDLTASPANSNGVRPVGVLLSDIQPERVQWLWKGRIPLGKLSVLDGDPGLGKTTVGIDIAARVTTSRTMPDGTASVEGGVVILTAEDGLADTVRPRLDAAGGDPTRVLALPVVGHGKDEHEPMLPDDLGAVEVAIKQVGAALVMVDPLMAYLSGDVNAHRDQDVRRALRQLASLAERTGAAVLVVRHLNKVGGSSPIYRGGGSVGIIGAARSGLLVAKDPEDESLRVLASTKANLGPEAPSLGYRLAGVYDPEGVLDGVARVEWLGEHAASATQLLATREPESEEAKTAIEHVMDVLREMLSMGPVPAKKARGECAAVTGASSRTIDIAKGRLGVSSSKHGFGDKGTWVWELPKDAGCPPKDENNVTPADFTALGQKPASLAGENEDACTHSVISTVDGISTCVGCGAWQRSGEQAWHPADELAP
jgi:hypothetical protein